MGLTLSDKRKNGTNWQIYLRLIAHHLMVFQLPLWVSSFVSLWHLRYIFFVYVPLCSAGSVDFLWIFFLTTNALKRMVKMMSRCIRGNTIRYIQMILSIMMIIMISLKNTKIMNHKIHLMFQPKKRKRYVYLNSPIFSSSSLVRCSIFFLLL